MPQGGIDALVRFARVVSDTASEAHVLDELAGVLHARVCPDAVAVYALGADGKLALAAHRELPEVCRAIIADLDEMNALGRRIQTACGTEYATHVARPLVAGGNLFGAVILVCKPGNEPDATKLSVADGFIDLASLALETAAHVAQLERQFEELRKQQEILARTEKLRALGQMAAGVSHDLKNILNPLSLHIQVIARAIDRGNTDDAKESAVEMKQVLQRGVQTLERLREFSRQEKESKTELVELDRLAREAAAIGKSRSASTGGGRVVKIVEQLASPPAVMAVGGEVVSALVNLVVNAVDAGAKTITLKSGEEDAGAWVAIQDDGPGMPEEIAKRVFEPFFTTKGQEGTGLGLAMVYASMQRHGGRVTLDTEPGRGTSFKLWFPITPQSQRSMPAHPSQ